MDGKIRQLKGLITRQKNILILTGAGIQTDSGIPDYRGMNGIYKELNFGCSDPTKILSAQYFENNTENFYRFYLNKMVYPDAKPNSGHLWIKKLEDLGKNVRVITQNIDGLHTMAGSKNVYEIHGNSYRYQCTYCDQWFNTNVKKDVWPKKNGVIPLCPICGHILKPDVVLYGEKIELPKNVNLDTLVKHCDIVVVMGTSLQVQPANDIPLMASNMGIPIYVINLTDYSDNLKMKDVNYVFIQQEIQKFVKEIEDGDNLFDGKSSHTQG